MSAYTHIISNMVFPLQETFKQHDTVHRRKSLEDSQWWSRQRIDDLQLTNLKKFLSECQAKVPYYQNLFKQYGFNPDAVKSVADLQQLPTLDKRTIRNNLQALKADGAPLSQFNTGGSSGEPLIFFLGKDRVSHDVAAKWRATRWWNVDIGDQEVVIWGSPIELGAQSKLRLLRDKIFRSALLSATKLSDQRLDEFLGRIEQCQPKMLFGYPSVISMLAERSIQRGMDLKKLGVRVVFVTAECLYQHQRELIEAAFGCPVANGYGGRDAGFLAHECPHGSMHISAEDIVIEILDADGQAVGPGIEGEIVVTHTATYGFPFVRYRTGDIGSLSDGKCECGRGLPMIEKIIGRTNDFVISNSGEKFHGSSLTYVIRGIEGINSFKVIQLDRHTTSVQLTINDSYQPGSEEVIRRAFKSKLGDMVEVNFEYLDAIPAEKSGKYRYVVSHAD